MSARARGERAPGGAPTAVYLAQSVDDLNRGASFLARLAPDRLAELRALGTAVSVGADEGIFHQGDRHTGIWLIESGSVRTYYVSPAGREITLANWTEGHFVGGPEVFGGGEHIWSADALAPTQLLFLRGTILRDAIARFPEVALCLIEGLVAKGRCYSALVQMLGTRSVADRLVHLLVILAETHGRQEGDGLVIERQLTHEDIASIVGATRQWVTMTFDRLQKAGLIVVTRRRIVLLDVSALRRQLSQV